VRLVLASDSYPPLIGGGTRDTALLAEELARRGHAVTVITVQQPGLPAVEHVGGVVVHRVSGATPRLSRDPHRRHQAPVVDPLTTRAVRRIVSGTRPDLVSTYGWISYSVAAATASARTPLVLTVRDSSTVCANRTLIQRRSGGDSTPCSGPAWGKCWECARNYYGGIARPVISVGGVLGGRGRLIGRVSGVHWCSTFLASTVAPHLDLPDDVLQRVIPPFRSAVVGEPDQAAMDRLPPAPYVLFVGQFRWEKGLRLLLETWQRLAAAPPLVLIGSAGDDLPQTVPPDVTILRDASPATVLAAWDRAMFGVAPSVLPEGFGNVVHEAMSRGRPVIGTAPSGMSDIIDDGVDGVLVPRGDAPAFEQAVRRLLDDPALVARLAETTRAKAARFTAEAVVPQVEDFFRSVADSGAVSAGS
jgi:glycosyltransferase involved in cell wall biosynthesis